MTVAPDVLTRTAERPLARRDATAALLRRATSAQDYRGREHAIEEVVVLNMGVARSLASRYRNKGVPLEDLEQVAYLALLRAARRFDPKHAEDFLSYAVPTMRGELKRYFRDFGWAVRPPRRAQEIQTQVLATERELEHELARRPTAAEIGAVLGEREGDVQQALTAQGCFHPTSLDQKLGSDSATSLGDRLHDESDQRARDAIEARLLLRPVLGRLRDRERRIVRLRFFEERTQQEIADELGVTQTQVSRLLTRILAKLRQELGTETHTVFQ